LAGFNTSSVTFLGLKQKWQRTLSSVSKQKRVLRQWESHLIHSAVQQERRAVY
jgi:hypothetical protein